MPRTVQIVLPKADTEELIEKIVPIDGLLGLRVNEGISLQPPGDVISLEITNDALEDLVEILNKEGMLDSPHISVSTAQPSSVLSIRHSKTITTDSSEVNWEETLSTINDQSQMTINNILTMFLAGVIAVMGMTTNAVHIVVGASLLAPGFGAITRISLGVVTRHYTWKDGVKDTTMGYVALISGATIASLIMRFLGEDIISGTSSYLSIGVLLDYHTTVTVQVVVVSILASIIGALLILSNRTILTAGVMVVLSLVPSATITGMGLVGGEYQMAAKAFGWLLMEMFIVAVFTGLVFILKRKTVFQRSMKI